MTIDYAEINAKAAHEALQRDHRFGAVGRKGREGEARSSRR
jgi:hypothetical protein